LRCGIGGKKGVWAIVGRKQKRGRSNANARRQRPSRSFFSLSRAHLLEGVAEVDVHEPRRGLVQQDVGGVAVPDAQHVPHDGGGGRAPRVVQAAAVPEGRVRVALEEEEAEGGAEALADGGVGVALLLERGGVLEAVAALARRQVPRVVARVQARVRGAPGAQEDGADGLCKCGRVCVWV
jgi:hypothetical protein